MQLLNKLDKGAAAYAATHAAERTSTGWGGLLTVPFPLAGNYETGPRMGELRPVSLGSWGGMIVLRGAYRSNSHSRNVPAEHIIRLVEEIESSFG